MNLYLSLSRGHIVDLFDKTRNNLQAFYFLYWKD